MLDALDRQIDHLRISLTNKCNLDCFYCHREGNTNNKEMSTEKVFGIIDAAKSSGISSLKFTGGEPLLRKDITQIIEYAVQTGLFVGLTINGTMLAGKTAKLRKAGLNRINIGLDTLTTFLPKNRKSVVEGIKDAKSQGMDVKINMVVMQQNHLEIDDMIQLCKHMKINLQLIELIPCKDYHKHFIDLTEIEKNIASISDNMETREMQNRTRYFFGDIFVEFVRPGRQFCSGCNKLRITADGRVKPCLMQKKTINFTGQESIKKACKMRLSYGYN